jgi:predicted PurR-regulated permease PerM
MTTATFFGLHKQTLHVSVTILVILCAVFALLSARTTLVTFGVATLLAYLIAPAVGRIQAVAKVSREVALAILFAVTAVVLAIAMHGVGALLAEQASAVVTKVPAWLKERASKPLPGILAPATTALANVARRTGAETAIATAGDAVRWSGSLASLLLQCVLVPLLAFLLVRDGRSLHATVLSTLPLSQREAVESFLVDVHILLGAYMRSLVTLSAASTLFFAITLTALSVPFSLLFAVISGLGEFLPVLGPFAAAVSTLLIALLASFSSISTLIALFAGWRLFIDYYLYPRMMGSRSSLPPLAVIFAVFAGEELGGMAGAFFAVPIMATVIIAVKHRRKAKESLKVLE